MSYSYYLTHALGLHMFFVGLKSFVPNFGGNVEPFFLWFLGPAFVVSFTFALPVYLFVERPFSLKPDISSSVKFPLFHAAGGFGASTNAARTGANKILSCLIGRRKL
jgi:peptidoglycan/LPS O-acetylase OafA/YrhL